MIFYLFPNYLEAYGALIILSFSKYSALLLFVPVTLLTAFSKELLIIKAYFLAIIIMIFMQFLVLLLNPEYFWALALFSSLSVLLVCFYLWNLDVGLSTNT